jgi:hypothetical protein
LNSASLQGLSDNITTMLDKYIQLIEIKDFTIQVLNLGQIYKCKINADKIGTLVLSDKKDNNYFDFASYFLADDQLSSIYYSKTHCQGFQHSGDVKIKTKKKNLTKKNSTKKKKFV